MRRDCAHPQRRPESAEAQLSSSASFSLRSSAAWGPATLLSLLAERCEQKDGGSARFEPRRESRRRLLKNAAWECLLLPALRHRLPSADPRDTVPIRSTTTAASSPCPPSSSPFSSSSFSSCARSWALEISQQLILRGREEDGQALLLLSEVLLSRSSSAFPSLPPSSSAVTFLKSGGFCERRLRDPGAVVYLLLLLSAPLAAPRDSREDATNPSGNANREKLPDGCRASDFSRQVLGVAGVRTPQLDARLLRLAFTGKLAPGAAREIPSVSPPASILSEGVSAELKEEIRAAARRLGFRGRCAVLPASTTQTQMGKAGTDGEGIACNEDDRKRRGDTGEERDNVGERDKDREREDSNFGQELPSERRVEKMCSGVLLPRERPGPVSTQLSVANRSHSSEEDLSAAFSSLSLGSGIAELELDQESGQCRAGDNLSPAGNLCPDRSRGEARESGPSSLRSLFAPVSPPEFSFRPFGALPFPALMEKGAAACTFSEATPLSLCDAQGDRLDVYSQPHGRDRKVEEREARERAFAWRHGGAWRGCFHREGLAPSLLAPVKEDECPFRLGSLHAEEPFAVQSENPFATPSSVSASSSSASSFSGVPDAPFPSALSSDFSASPGVAFRSSSGPGHRPSGGGDESTPPPFPERSLSFFSLPQSRLLGADEGRFAFFSASFEGRQTSEETEGRDAGTRKANNFFGKLDTLGRDKAARVDTPVVRPLQFPWTSETEEAAALEGERRKTLPGRYRAEAPRDETAPTAAVATPDAWEREMTAWLYSQEAASQSSGARKDEVLRVPTRFASWDMRMLQPRIQRVAELLDRRKIEPSDAGWTTESWTSQMLSCIDSRTAECMGTFLATAYGTMTVGGLDSRFALLSADSRSNRERCPYVRPVPALVSAASSAIVPRRLTLAAVLSTSPPPPPPFGFRACPRSMSPLLEFLENWVFRANVYDPGDEFLRPLPGGSPSRFPSLTLGCTYRRRLTDSGHADSRVGCLWPLEDEANGACVSSFFSDEDAQQRWSDRAAGAVGAASQVNFVLPSFLLSIQQEIHKTGLLLLILLHASPEAFQAASLATSFSRSSSPSFSSFPSAASTSMAASTSLAPSLAGESVKCESVPPKPEAEPATAPDPAAASVLAFAVPSLTLEGFSRTLDMRNGMTSRSFFSSHVQPFASLLASAPAASPSLPGSEAALACASSVSFPFAEAKQARTGGRRGPGVLEFSVFLRELLRVEQKYRGLRALGLTRVWCLVEAQQVCVQLREAAREEQFRRARAFLHQRIRLSHQTQLLQLQRARLSREMIRAAAALASQKTTSCPSLTDVWREVAKRQKEEQKSVLDRQRQEQEAARRRREAADASGLALEAAENRRSLKERQERLHADLERQLREQRLEFEQLEQQLKQLQQLQRDMGKSFSSLSPVSHPNVCLHGDPQLLVGRSSAKTRFESRKLTAGLMHAEHAVQTAAAALASVERALERRRAREREREKGREDADDSRGGKGVHVSQPPGGNSVIGDLLKDPEKEKKEDGDPFRASSLASPALPPPSSASICLSYDLSSRGEESNASPGKDQLSRAVPASPGERKREDANEASSSATDTATSETKKAEKETRVCSPALSEAIQIEAGAWTTTAASSPRTGDSVDSLEETPFTENGDEDRYEEEASEHREEGGRWRKELERRGDQGNLNRSIWICVGQAVATQHAVANRAFLALMGPQHCDLLGCLDTVKKFILFGASDVMGQFAVDLIAELQKKEAEEKKLRRAFLSRATSKEGCSADPSSRLTGCTYAQDFESSRKLHVARYTELINTLFASALAPISFAPPQPCASEGARDAGGAKPSRRFPGAHGHCGAGVEARHAVLGVSSTTASNVAVSFQLSGGNVRAGGDESASPDSPRNQESRGRNVEELLMDVEVSMHAPFPLTLFFDAVRTALEDSNREALGTREDLADAEHPHSPAATGRSWRRRSRNGDEDACAGDWAEDGFLLPPGLYAHMWQLCVKMKFVTDAFHGYVITDALQTEWTALTVYIHRTVEAALAPPRCRRSAKDRHSRDTSPHPIPLACAARESAQTPSNRFSSSPQGGTGNLARSGGTPQCRPSGAAEEGSETLKRPEVRNFETRRLTAADSGEEASAFGLFAAHRKTITSIHTRCLLSPRLAPLHQHVMDVLRASWALRALQQQLEGDERHLRDLLVQQTKKWRELSRQRGQVDKEALDLPAEKARVVRASFANFLQAPDAVQPNSSSPRNAPPQQNCGIGELIQREEEAILAAKRGIERAGVAAGLVAAQQLLKIEKTFNAACDGLMRALQKLEPLQLLDALALRLDFNRFYSREAAMKAARASVERKVRGL
ncbi:conserved hypothetical protein [Neospora caninum Liverpool]|uniref:Gamma tubulin complex component C-terminal domain-containing protein n=1 Tax=Neospora caninum (strain Liverpool) TaxID=572307 RepID=F0VDF1_NEOCL|nr:conserved hypothetical protein [Neospora caninum Liverpool]CBZ51666.1 conserved hypothetical protein [Neospora caninum Liverpool]|eukprot:XP_003881699.1 conserved hypothetical protein [Neospora caninum Liverpool]